MTALKSRDAAFDFVKGILVLVMVLYHVMSIMSAAIAEDFRYIRFISGSFIFISGYILGRFSDSAFKRDPQATTRGLIVRGLKLLAIFTVLNLLIHTTGVGNVSKIQLGFEGYLNHASSIYLKGDGQVSSFLILLPIAYLVMATPIFLMASALKRPAMALLMLSVALAAAAIPAIAERSGVLMLLLVGICGLCMGFLAGTASLSSMRFALSRPAALVGLAVSLWLSGHSSDCGAAYTIVIAMILKCLYDLAPSEPSGGPLSRATVLFRSILAR